MHNLLTGVVGAGVMGTGVAQSLAQAGHRVILVDLSEQILQQAKEQIINNIRFQKIWHKAALQENVDDIIERITFTSHIATLEPVEFVIENVVEQWEIKHKVYT